MTRARARAPDERSDGQTDVVAHAVVPLHCTVWVPLGVTPPARPSPIRPSVHALRPNLYPPSLPPSGLDGIPSSSRSLLLSFSSCRGTIVLHTSIPHPTTTYDAFCCCCCCCHALFIRICCQKFPERQSTTRASMRYTFDLEINLSNGVSKIRTSHFHPAAGNQSQPRQRP